MLAVIGLVGLMGCPGPKDEGDPTETTTGPLGRCAEGKEDTGALAADALSAETFDDDATSPTAVVWVQCTDAECTTLTYNAAGSVGDRFEWYSGRSLVGQEDTISVSSADAASPITLAVRSSDDPDACDGIDVVARVGSYLYEGVAAPRVIITPLWITSSTTRPSGCNFVAGIGGCITDPLVTAFQTTGTSDKLTAGAPADLTPYAFDLTAGTATKGFAVWSAWDYTQLTVGTPFTSSTGTLPKALFPNGVSPNVNVGGTTYSDYLLFGWSVNKGYLVDIEETKLDNAGGVVDTSGAHSECSATAKGTIVFN